MKKTDSALCKERAESINRNLYFIFLGKKVDSLFLSRRGQKRHRMA